MLKSKRPTPQRGPKNINQIQEHVPTYSNSEALLLKQIKTTIKAKLTNKINNNGRINK